MCTSSVALFLGRRCVLFFLFFFFNDTATTEIYTLSLHDALPISLVEVWALFTIRVMEIPILLERPARSEEHTSELQSHSDLVCRLLLEKKKHSSLSIAVMLWLPNPVRRVRDPYAG